MLYNNYETWRIYIEKHVLTKNKFFFVLKKCLESSDKKKPTNY